MTGSLDKRTAIVTGAGGVIGNAIARKLLDQGYRVALADLDVTKVSDLSRDFGEDAFPVAMDVGDEASIDAAIGTVGEKFGRIDVVVNNAAVNHRGSIRDFSAKNWDHMMVVNLRGPALICQKLVPWWERQEGGSIVNIASRSWVAGGPPAYVACKAGLVGLTRSLARELAPIKVTANAIAPGLVPSAFTKDGRDDSLFQKIVERSIASTPLGRLTEGTDVANAVAFLASKDADYITGEVLHVCGGSQLAPLGGGNNT